MGNKPKVDDKIMGVCAFLSEKLNIDVVVIRILVIISLFISLGFTLLVYLLMGLFVVD